MIAVDTNVLVRLLVKDDEAQTRKVIVLFKRLSDAADTAYVCDVVLCEVVWVLQACYKLKRKQIAVALRQLLSARQLTFDSPDQLSRALAAFEQGRGDLADYVIRERAKAAECDCVATFDKSLHKEPLFRSPDAV
jgi:predicted nucleic-acid-binding protein